MSHFLQIISKDLTLPIIRCYVGIVRSTYSQPGVYKWVLQNAYAQLSQSSVVIPALQQGYPLSPSETSDTRCCQFLKQYQCRAWKTRWFAESPVNHLLILSILSTLHEYQKSTKYQFSCSRHQIPLLSSPLMLFLTFYPSSSAKSSHIFSGRGKGRLHWAWHDHGLDNFGTWIERPDPSL